MEKYFPFSRLEQMYDILSAVVIGGGVILVVYTLAGLFYYTTKELLKR